MYGSGVRRARKRATPSVKTPTKDPEGHGRLGVNEELVQNVVLESLVVQEMLRRLHPEVFTTSLMKHFHVVATKEMANRFKTTTTFLEIQLYVFLTLISTSITVYIKPACALSFTRIFA